MKKELLILACVIMITSSFRLGYLWANRPWLKQTETVYTCDRTTLIANDYPGDTLQEKINNAYICLPPTGGIVAVRPGKYDIDKPLSVGDKTN